MKAFLDCIPCFVRQALDTVRLVTDDEAIHGQLLREVLRAAGEMDLDWSPPVMGQRVHRMVRRLAGDSDPYLKMKQHFNRLALNKYAALKRCVESSDAPMETAVRLAIAGNVIDLGVNSDLSEAQIDEAIEHALTTPFDGSVEEFCAAVSNAGDILYLADNAGEIVFDKLLVERMSPEKVTVVVKGAPIINDAVMDDARDSGMTDLVKVIDNGSDAPGTILDDCSEAFRRRFDEADLVIAKGQGNYETLSDVPKDIFFVLKAKCPVIARDLSCEVGSLVLRRSSHAEAATGKGNRYAGI